MIAIPNMGMPQTCGECELRAFDEWEDEYCVILRDDILVPYERMLDCPLIDIVQCKDCKWFKLDVWGELNGIPVIVAHEMCKFWGNGCKTNPNAFCSYGERRDDEHMD